MSVQAVRDYLEKFGYADRITEFSESTATVELAAAVVGVIPARIAKTLSFKVNEAVILVVAAGDAKIDNRKYKDKFGAKAKMLTAQEAIDLVGHPVGGVCPFAVNEGVTVYLDESLKRFETVFPAAGSAGSAVKLSCEELFESSQAAEWVDVCKIPENED
ncbi:MAG: YbaK/EbsC family protein [Clostridia bacterium]|nr:YbaK/EbsC family protein [Clostridia bacterium]